MPIGKGAAYLERVGLLGLLVGQALRRPPHDDDGVERAKPARAPREQLARVLPEREVLGAELEAALGNNTQFTVVFDQARAEPFLFAVGRAVRFAPQ